MKPFEVGEKMLLNAHVPTHPIYMDDWVDILHPFGGKSRYAAVARERS